MTITSSMALTLPCFCKKLQTIFLTTILSMHLSIPLVYLPDICFTLRRHSIQKIESFFVLNLFHKIFLSPHNLLKYPMLTIIFPYICISWMTNYLFLLICISHLYKLSIGIKFLYYILQDTIIHTIYILYVVLYTIQYYVIYYNVSMLCSIAPFQAGV